MLSIVMLTYGENQVELACSAIDAIKLGTRGEYELLVWVNGDVDADYNGDLTEHCDFVLGTNERLGIAQAYNVATNYLKGDVICVIHSDCFVEPGWETALIEAAQDGNIGFPIVKGNDDIAAARGIAVVPDWMPPSCCFAISRDYLEQLGGWDEQFEFCHFEDMDLFRRATKMGMRLVQVPSEVFHVRGVTRADQVDLANEAFRANEKRYAAKHGIKEGDTIKYYLPVLELLETKEDSNVVFH